MQIEHEKARKLIQFNADGVLAAPEKLLLSAHLKECSECRAFADEIKEVEHLLLPVMKRQWNLQPIPFSTGVFASKRNLKAETRILLATRTAIISLMAVTFLFGIWQFSLSAGPASSLPGIPPIPTPSLQTTGTKNVFEGCEMMLYRVQGNDTLTGIASQFSVSKEMIMTINHMKTETLDTTRELNIPICNLTPTGTLNPTTHTTTYTPATEPIISTATRY
jgi:hypothetical protein